jgi:release factor glutamine methyltransferase
VAEEELAALAPEVREWEPREALLAEEGGLAILRALVDGASGVLRPSGILALEVGVGQARWVMERIRGTMAFAEPDVLRDLSGRERVVIAVREAGGPWAAPSRTSLDSKGP